MRRADEKRWAAYRLRSAASTSSVVDSVPIPKDDRFALFAAMKRFRSALDKLKMDRAAEARSINLSANAVARYDLNTRAADAKA